MQWGHNSIAFETKSKIRLNLNSYQDIKTQKLRNRNPRWTTAYSNQKQTKILNSAFKITTRKRRSSTNKRRIVRTEMSSMGSFCWNQGISVQSEGRLIKNKEEWKRSHDNLYFLHSVFSLFDILHIHNIRSSYLLCYYICRVIVTMGNSFHPIMIILFFIFNLSQSSQRFIKN